MIRSTVRASASEASGVPVPAATRCPECGCWMPAGAEICEICLADLGERSMAPSAADLPPAAAESDLRFSDVIAELEALAQLASEGEELSTTAQRAGSLLTRLRAQFMLELGRSSTAPGASSSPV